MHVVIMFGLPGKILAYMIREPLSIKAKTTSRPNLFRLSQQRSLMHVTAGPRILARIEWACSYCPYLPLQLPDDGELAFDNFMHMLEQTGKGVTPSLVAQQLAFIGKGMFERDEIGSGQLDHLRPSGRKKNPVCSVCHCVLLHSGGNNHAAHFFLGE